MRSNLSLTTPIQYVPKIGPVMAQRLKKLAIETVHDLLLHIPFRYDDFSNQTPIASVQENEPITIQGTIQKIENVYTRNRKKIQKAVIQDASGILPVTWFNQTYLPKTIPVGTYISLSGKAKRFGNTLILQSPAYEILQKQGTSTYDAHHTPIHTGRLVPVYSLTSGIHAKWLRGRVEYILTTLKGNIPETLPDTIIKKQYFPSLEKTINTLHFPKKESDIITARNRLAFEELLIKQIISTIRRKKWQQQTAVAPLTITDQMIKTITKSLPFTLTAAQSKALTEIIDDLKQEHPMNRLLEGDVGSGKTIVSAIAAYCTYKNKLSTLVMAPTEILATQQYTALKKFLHDHGISIALVTGSHTQSSQPADIIIGTHALLHRKLRTTNSVGLVVVDEQQRFGVAQRSILRHTAGSNGALPHFLTMTATPIPRTIALTLYGDLSLSIIDQMPVGRKPVKTWMVPPKKRNDAYEWIRKNNFQTFIICPLIEESETLATAKSAKQEYEKICTLFADRKIGLVHGRMKGSEKDMILQQFRDKKIDVLVATPVVEVGIDIPSAQVIIIESAERFGLAQLHQLRGRVGRSNKQSYCLLFGSSSPQTYKRLKHLETTHSGPKLAEIDLSLRGPGSIYGVAQSGLPDMRFANYSDLQLMQQAKKEATHILANDPELIHHKRLSNQLQQATIDDISPD